MSEFPTDSTSVSLLQKVCDRDFTAWSRLAQIYSPLVYLWCRKSGLQNSDVDDVAQEVFRAVATGIQKFLQSEHGKFRGWLWGITRNKLADHFRHQDALGRPIGGDQGQEIISRICEPVSGEISDFGIDVDVLVVQKTLDLLREEFEPKSWQAFWRTTVGGERATDIADELNMSKKAVRQAKYRILHRLRGELESQLNRGT